MSGRSQGWRIGGERIDRRGGRPQEGRVFRERRRRNRRRGNRVVFQDFQDAERIAYIGVRGRGGVGLGGGRGTARLGLGDDAGIADRFAAAARAGIGLHIGRGGLLGRRAAAGSGGNNRREAKLGGPVVHGDDDAQSGDLSLIHISEPTRQAE